MAKTSLVCCRFCFPRRAGALSSVFVWCLLPVVVVCRLLFVVADTAVVDVFTVAVGVIAPVVAVVVVAIYIYNIIIFNEESFVTYDVIFTKVLHKGTLYIQIIMQL